MGEISISSKRGQSLGSKLQHREGKQHELYTPSGIYIAAKHAHANCGNNAMACMPGYHTPNDAAHAWIVMSWTATDLAHATS